MKYELEEHSIKEGDEIEIPVGSTLLTAHRDGPQILLTIQQPQLSEVTRTDMATHKVLMLWPPCEMPVGACMPVFFERTDWGTNSFVTLVRVK